jgi:Ni/Co efflux regulator RcnB
MRKVEMLKNRLSLLIVAGAIASTAAFAQPPHAKGHGKGKEKAARHFSNDHRGYVRDYYAEEYRSGNCPPGLAKKRNGCLPPGQAKKWRVGQPLPADVVIYDVPAPLVARIGPPPSGHKYVRVGADILMIAIGTSMVVDALSDLSRIR